MFDDDGDACIPNLDEFPEKKELKMGGHFRLKKIVANLRIFAK